MRIDTDYLVIGSGIAGLTFALEASRFGRVTVLTKRAEDDAATTRAQGGIAAVLAPDDSFREHMADTLATGNGIAHRSVVELVVTAAPERIQALMELGTRFSTAASSDESRKLDLAREGGHGKRRIVHANDITGAEVQRALLEAARANSNIEIMPYHMVIDLAVSSTAEPTRIIGAYALDTLKQRVLSVSAKATVLATGGAGKVYLYTSNPDIATGDGVAMAYRAGAEVANMEFFQFHPTCLYHPEAKNFLISEALRGEGGILRLRDGTPFMERHHPLRDLAPRDVVARAIDLELKRSGDDFVLLDMTVQNAEFLRERFPNIYERTKSLGIDLTVEPIPVVPAAHYMCGGVVVDRDGRTTLPGLWAIGEVSCTGLHGANRLASNSLLEGLVFAHRAAIALSRQESRSETSELPDWDPGDVTLSEEGVVVTNDWDELRRCMWNYVGIARSNRRLARASRRIALLKHEIHEYYVRHFVTMDLLELRNIADVAEMITTSAALRRESRGLHYNLDHPERDDAHFLADTMLRRGALPMLRKLPSRGLADRGEPLAVGQGAP